MTSGFADQTHLEFSCWQKIKTISMWPLFLKSCSILGLVFELVVYVGPSFKNIFGFVLKYVSKFELTSGSKERRRCKRKYFRIRSSLFKDLFFFKTPFSWNMKLVWQDSDVALFVWQCRLFEREDQELGVLSNSLSGDKLWPFPGNYWHFT